MSGGSSQKAPVGSSSALHSRVPPAQVQVPEPQTPGLFVVQGAPSKHAHPWGLISQASWVGGAGSVDPESACATSGVPESPGGTAPPSVVPGSVSPGPGVTPASPPPVSPGTGCTEPVSTSDDEPGPLSTRSPASISPPGIHRFPRQDSPARHSWSMKHCKLGASPGSKAHPSPTMARTNAMPAAPRTPPLRRGKHPCIELNIIEHS
jgi:hypothetical protein